jgi:cation diffusion facilitator CzcD-associated flavoprotein CzcO
MNYDIVVIGAGITGIGSLYYLKKELEADGKKFICFDNKESFGGTWLIHQYPGIRSDSDLFTFGYAFRPWLKAKNPPLVTGEEILEYLGNFYISLSIFVSVFL